MAFDYSVAIKLSIANLASQGLKMFERDLLGANIAATKLQDKIKGLKLAAVGYGLEKVGSGIFGFLEKSIDASKEYTRQLSLMNAAGMTQRDIALSTAAAWQTSRDVLTTTAADNLKAIRELRSVFGNKNMGEAYEILPTVQRTRAVMEALTGKPQENVAFDMVKAIELRTPGLMSQAAMQSNADLMARSLMGMGGTINVNDFHKTLKQTKQAAFGLNDDFVYNYLPTLMQEVKAGPTGGAQSAGTAIATLYRAIVQGVIRKSSIPLWEEAGLIKPEDIVRNSTGGMQLKPGAVSIAKLFQENPYLAAQKFSDAIAPVMARHHLNREQAITGMFGDRNAAWAMNTMIAKAPQFERDKTLIQSGGTSIETYQKLMKTNPQLAEEAMHAQWQNILSILGYQILPRILPLMVKFATGLDNISQWMEKHPNLTQGLVIGLGGLAVSLSVLGKVMMMAGLIKFLGIGPAIMAALTPMGLVVGAIVAIGAAGYELYKHWAWIKDKLGLGDDWRGSVGHYGGPNADWGGSAGHRAVVTKGGSGVTVHVHNTFDKHGIATMVADEHGKAVNGPQHSTSTFDPTLSIPQAGGGYSMSY
jgi:hypothetical protein